MNKIFISIVFMVLFGITTLPIRGQILVPPDLSCTTTQVNGDVTLTWRLPLNACGPFVAYEIYASNNIAGPYSLLTSINTQATTTFLHVGADGNNMTWYYYMQSNFNCPGFIPASSDTLDNLDPEAPIIDYITVNISNEVELNWQPSSSPETFAYIIYRFNGGFIPIDTIYGRNNTFYIDPASNPDLKPEMYTIAAIDSCVNTGTFNIDPHRTIFLQQTVSNCTGFIDLTWTSYQGWQNVDFYSVYFSLNSGPFQLDGTVDGDTTNHQLTGFSNGDTLTFYIESHNPDGLTVSRSNETILIVDVIRKANFNYILRSTVTASQDVLVEWLPDSLASIASFEVMHGISATSLQQLQSITAPIPIPPLMQANNTIADPTSQSIYHQVIATDSCNLEEASGLSRTIHLSGAAQPDFTNQLTWNQYENAHTIVDRYRVYYDLGGSWTLLATLNPGELTYIHDISSLYTENGIFCYRIDADATFSAPSGVTITTLSSSNINYINQHPVIYAPTAIAPLGINTTFKPVISFFDHNTYSLKVFNRWGELIFKSNDYDTGWDGKINGSIVPAGVYVYLIEIMSVAGEPITSKGTVAVLR